MKPLFKASAIILLMALLSCSSDNNVDMPKEGYEGYTLIWQDEFESNIDPANWGFELGDGTAYGLPPGWGNNERQLYTDSQNNAFVRPDGEGNSVLSIVARENGSGYTSAKLTTENKQSFRFGRIEARIKLPTGKGLWPAFWMLGDNIREIDWPGCGEMDILEIIGQEPNVVHSSAWYTNSENKVGTTTGSLNNGESLADDYHIYRLDWTPNSLIYSIDDREIKQVVIESDMKEFLRSFYLIFNVAVGGHWPGDPDETTVFPQEMWVDWVRVYEKDDLDPGNEPPLDIQEETIGVLLDFIAHVVFNSQFNQFEGIGLKSWGAGGEPTITVSEDAIEGDSSLLFSYPGGNWGGGFFEMDTPIDASEFNNGTLVFSIKAPPEMTDIEVKLESVSTFFSVFLTNYTGTDVGNGYVEYRIPITDFDGLELHDLRIPMSLWNPTVASGDYLVGDVLLDNVYFE